MSYHRFTASMRLADLVRADVSLLRVLARFDLHPGFKEMTVAEVCAARRIDPDFLIEIINVFHDPLYFPILRLQQLDARWIVGYLQCAHLDYTGRLLPAIGESMRALAVSGGSGNKGIAMAGAMFDAYCREFTEHIRREEECVFPHALRVAEAYRSGMPHGEAGFSGIQEIREFVEQHSHMEETLDDLQNILIAHVGQPFDVDLCRTVITELDLFARDIENHGRIEDRILFTLVENMEREIGARAW
jgi:regulator of cell morphogenesis and NO signaling